MMWTATYNHTQALLWQARKRLDTDDLSEEEQADAETVYALSQERLDDLERDYEYRISSSRWRP
jgi:hypothetical protein